MTEGTQSADDADQDEQPQGAPRRPVWDPIIGCSRDRAPGYGRMASASSGRLVVLIFVVLIFVVLIFVLAVFVFVVLVVRSDGGRGRPRGGRRFALTGQLFLQLRIGWPRRWRGGVSGVSGGRRGRRLVLGVLDAPLAVDLIGGRRGNR